MKVKHNLDGIVNRVKKSALYLLCFSPLLVVLFLTQEFFYAYLLYAFRILFMGILISLVFKHYKRILKLFMLPSYDEIITTKYVSTFYLKFIINVFCLTVLISILFYNESTNFVQYSYPALVFLCASRFLQNSAVNDFVEVIYGLTIVVILFAFMRLMGLLSKLEDSSLFAISFVNIPTITTEDMYLFILLSISVWAMLSICERLNFVNKMLKGINDN